MNTSKPLSSAGISLEGVTKEYGNAAVPAVSHVSFQVAPGSLVVLLGSSGSGKTTLLKMINRLVEATGGTIRIGDKDIRELPVTALRRQIGYVIQQVGLFPHMTIAENISVVPRLLGWDQARVDQRVKDLLDMVGLPLAYWTRRPRQLSGGEQQRVGLARALAADPAILLMDEPFAAVDAINRERLQGALLEIQRKVHKTILFVTHDVEEAFRLADKIAILQAGKLIQYGTPLEIVSRPQNEFVQELVGTKNVLRSLSLMNVQSILDAHLRWESRPVPANLSSNRMAFVRPGDDLRRALSALLYSGGDTLQVVDQEGRQVGEITFDDLRTFLFQKTSKTQAQA